MNLKEFLKDKELNQITIEGQVYFKLPLVALPQWEGIYKNNSWEDFTTTLKLIGFIRKTDNASFYYSKTYQRTPESKYFDYDFDTYHSEFKQKMLKGVIESVKNIKPTKSSKPTTDANHYFLNNLTPTYTTCFEDIYKPKIIDILSYLITGSIDVFLTEYLQEYKKTEEKRRKEYVTLIYELEQLNNKQDPTTTELRTLLSAIKGKLSINLVYNIPTIGSWSGKISTEDFEDIKRFSIGISSWEIKDVTERINFNNTFDNTVLYACGIKEIIYRNKTIYKRNEDLFIFCPNAESLSKIIKEEVPRIDNGYLEQLRQKHKKEFYYLGTQGVCLLKSEWKENN